MVSYRIFAFAGLAAALPLNINLGAYSPALVVGDGEISFGGRQDVSNLMNALEGAAFNAAAGATNGAAAAPAAAAPAAAAPAVAAPAATPAAAVPAPAASAPAANGAAVADQTLSSQAQQIAALQGMGKEIAPRIGDRDETAVHKRDITGFNRALQYAEAALTKGPKIQLGTGEGGAGVGIIVDNNPTAAARPGTGAAAKRDLSDETLAPIRRTKVTTMYVRRGVPASLQSSEMARRVAEAETAPRAVSAGVPAVPAVIPTSRRDAIDAVNLNVDGDEGVTLTFVEEVDGTEDD